MAKFRVITEGVAVQQILLSTVHDVDRYVARIRTRNNRPILVGDDGSEITAPYEEWRAGRTEARHFGATE